MDRKPIENLKAVSKFNPSQPYGWNPDDVFSVSGAEIDAWNKALAACVNTDEYQRFTLIQRAAILMNDFIKDGVEQGLIKPIKKEKSEAKNEVVVEEVSENGLTESTNG